MRVQWVHPSLRDLVIEHLARDERGRDHFLHSCSVHGVLLALSTEGALAGERRFPLLDRDADWDGLTDRLYVLAPELGEDELIALLDALAVAFRESPTTELDALVRAVLARVAHVWDARRGPVALPALEAWLALARDAPADPPLHAIAVTWAELLPTGPPDLTDPVSVERFADWLTLATVVRDYEPRLLAELGFPGRSRRHIERLIDGLDIASKTALGGAILEPAVRAVARTADLIPELAEQADGIQHSLRRTWAWEDPPLLSSPFDRGPLESSGYLDVERVLRDL